MTKLEQMKADLVEFLDVIKEGVPGSTVPWRIADYVQEAIRIRESGLVEGMREIQSMLGPENREEFVQRFILQGAFAVVPILNIANNTLSALEEECIHGISQRDNCDACEEEK